ncbi:hypothetical protein M885DRAFT_624101 [Pelagophyceae sp. CCMP2097]|nr:hypothetical protein M885DRAFT_624101 [Pelagophyceae sp. CCMP2097]
MSSDEDDSGFGGRGGLGSGRNQSSAWMGEDDDEDDKPRGRQGGKGGGRGKGGKGGKGKKVTFNDSAPISFVLTAPPPPPAAPAPRAAVPFAPAAAAASNADFRKSLLSEQARAEAERVARAAKKELPPAAAVQPEWERHTKGVGFTMLQKMGFTGRLGKESKGVSASVTVQQRPTGMGLGFGGGAFKEESQLEANITLQRELGHEVIDKPEVMTAKRAATEGEVQERKRRKKIFANAAAMAAEVDALPAGRRAPAAHNVAFAISDETAAKGAAAAAEPPELRLARRVLEDLETALNSEEAAQADALRREGAEAERHAALRDDATRARQKSPALQRHGARLRAFRAALADLEAAARTVVSSDDFLARVKKVRSQFEDEWKLAGASRLLPAMVAALARAQVGTGWDALAEPSRGPQAAAQWRPARFCETLEDEGDEFFESDILPECRAALASRWVPGEDAATDARALELGRWLSAVNSRARSMVSAMVAPKLRSALADAGDAAKATQRRRRPQPAAPAHAWAAAWLDDSTSASIFDDAAPLREAAAKVVSAELILAIVDGGEDAQRLAARAAARWRGALGAAAWKRLAAATLPRALAAALRRGWAVDPTRAGGQDWAPVDALRTLGAGLGVPDHTVAALLTGEVAPKWLRALKAWLDLDGADLDEVAVWYLEWRTRLLGGAAAGGRAPSALGLLAAQAWRDALTVGLALIDLAILDHRAAKAAPLPGAADARKNSYETALAALRRGPAEADAAPFCDEGVSNAADAAGAAPQKQAMWGGAGLDAQGGIVFLDVVERFAAEHDVVLLPRPGRSHAGKQLYAFAKATIYLDRSVTFVRQASGSFAPIALEDLLAIVRNT